MFDIAPPLHELVTMSDDVAVIESLKGKKCPQDYQFPSMSGRVGSTLHVYISCSPVEIKI